MKKNRIYILILLLLLIITAVLYYKRGGTGTIKSELKSFAVEDTAAIDKIVLSDKQGRVLVLTKKNKVWYGNDSVKVRRDIIGTLLETIKRVEVKAPVNKAMRSNLMKQLATGAVQVEVFTDGDLERKFYVGGPTMDGFGTFMMLDGADDPFITHIPGFEGYLTVRFNTNVLVWKDREIFRYSPLNIKIIKIEYPKSTDASFTLRIEGKDYITLYNDAGDTASANINMEFLKKYLLNYSDIQYENIADPKKIPNLVELLTNENLLATITVYDKEGVKQSVELYKRYFDGVKFLPKSEEYDFDPDRCFVRLNGKDLYNGQYVVFNKLIVSFKDFFSVPLQ
jgi:hypothetical protein